MLKLSTRYSGLVAEVARQAHNLEVARSSRAPATRVVAIRRHSCPGLFFHIWKRPTVKIKTSHFKLPNFTRENRKLHT